MEIKKVCKNCKLYNKTEGTCSVTVVHEGSYYELPVLPDDKCFWEEEDIPVSLMRAWSDGTNGYIETQEDEPYAGD